MQSKAHLRSRGEDPAHTRRPAPWIGSPPLARRGRRTGGLPGRHEPAHLRSRGEDAIAGRKSSADCGSPPLARRGRAISGPYVTVGRLTSARAERTPGAPPWTRRATAHLRSRGEDHSNYVNPDTNKGSPPLARRGLLVIRGRVRARRLTSARAERTTGTPKTSPWSAAHLRSRGEDRKMDDKTILKAGSPPLARRGHEVVLRQQFSRRLTSARAERTPSDLMRSRSQKAHLRSRGEDKELNQRHRPRGGSPPLARRGRQLNGSRPGDPRLTSARAERTAPA